MDPTALGAVLRFAPPAYRSHSRSPPRSPPRSPSRRQHFASKELDPLLSSLSPTSTLEALQATHLVGTSDYTGESLLRDSITAVSTSERALGIRAALAGKNLRAWHAEIVSWPWAKPSIGQRSGFLAPPAELRSGVLPNEGPRTEVGEYWGSLPANKIRQYEERIESIMDDMESLEVEELKDYVRDAHLQPRSRPSSRYGPGDSILQSNYARLDDFTAVITATIMHALPYITRINVLLDEWSVRLIVLRQVRGFLEHLEEAQTYMATAWQTSGSYGAARKDDQKNFLPRAIFDGMKSLLQSRIQQLGGELDGMLDILEGREDTIPEEWIDSMENIEAQFGRWVIESENQVLEKEWGLESRSREEQVEQAEFDGPPPLRRMSRSEELPELPVSFPQPVPNDSSNIQNTTEAQLPTLTSQGNIEHDNEIVDIYELNASEDHFGFPKRPTGQIRSPNQRNNNDSTVPMTWNQYKELSADRTSTVLYGTLERPSEAIIYYDLVPSADVPSKEPLVVHLTGNDEDSGNGLPNGQGLSPLAFASQTDLLRTTQVQHSPSIKQTSNHRPRPPVLKQERPKPGLESNGSSDTSYPSSATTAYYSDMSSPEIYSASFAEYVGSPVEVVSPGWHEKESIAPTVALSRQSSQHTEKGSQIIRDIDTSSRPPTYRRSRASSFTPENSNHESSEAVEDDLFSDHEDLVGSGLKRASMTSIEILPRSEVRSIHVRRTGSQSSTSSTLSHFRNELRDLEKPLKMSSLRLETQDCGAHIPNVQVDGAQQLSTPNHERKSQPISEHPASPKSLRFKSHHRFEDISDLAAGSTPVNLRQNKSSPTEALKSRSVSGPGVSSDSTEDRLDARINSILSTIPARIRLTSSAKTSGSPRNPSVSKLDDGQSPSLRLTRAQTSYQAPISARTTPSQASRARSQNADPDIKLYHLHQPGKDAPIKLFVRLVGEGGERVMVRIGGGWADLGEYLKEYASHHGRRSISGGRFEIQGLPQSYTGSPQIPSGFASGRTTPSSSRPGSSESAFNPTIFVKKGHHLFGTPSTPEPFMPKQKEITPSSTGPHDVPKRPVSRQGWADDAIPLGLSGPKSKKHEVSPGKQLWVEGMIEQARQASAEKKKAKESDFGDVGKVGSTKRVFMKLRPEE